MTLEPTRNRAGQIELYGASVHLTDAITQNFTNRGQQAAQLLIATLTETPYLPTIDGTTFEVPVTNQYSGYGDDETSTKDTVDEAREALAEFIGAKVPGARTLGLERFKTRYSSILGDLSPGWRDDNTYKDAFDEALVETTRARGIEVASPAQARAIIAGAPRAVYGLRLSGHDYSHRKYDEQSHETVSEDGRIVRVRSYIRGMSTSPARYYLPTEPTKRGGNAPGSTIASKIEDRVVMLRTTHTKR